MLVKFLPFIIFMMLPTIKCLSASINFSQEINQEFPLIDVFGQSIDLTHYPEIRAKAIVCQRNPSMLSERFWNHAQSRYAQILQEIKDLQREMDNQTQFISEKGQLSSPDKSIQIEYETAQKKLDRVGSLGKKKLSLGFFDIASKTWKQRSYYPTAIKLSSEVNFKFKIENLDGSFAYILTEEMLLLLWDNTDGNTNHLILSGQYSKALGAGEAYFTQGQLVEANNQSLTFCPQTVPQIFPPCFTQIKYGPNTDQNPAGSCEQKFPECLNDIEETPLDCAFIKEVRKLIFKKDTEQCPQLEELDLHIFQSALADD